MCNTICESLRRCVIGYFQSHDVQSHTIAISVQCDAPATALVGMTSNQLTSSPITVQGYPQIEAATGGLKLQLATHVHGDIRLHISLGSNPASSQRLLISVKPVNDPPSFQPAGQPTLREHV